MCACMYDCLYDCMYVWQYELLYCCQFGRKNIYVTISCWYLSNCTKNFHINWKKIKKWLSLASRIYFRKIGKQKTFCISIFFLNNNSSRALFHMRWQCCLLEMTFYCHTLKYFMSHLRHLLKKMISSYCLMTKLLHLSLSKIASSNFIFLIKLSYYVYGPEKKSQFLCENELIRILETTVANSTSR